MEASFKEIALNLQISISTAHRIYKRFEDTGEVGMSADRRETDRSRFHKLEDLHEIVVITIVAENPGMYLLEICLAIKDATGVKVTSSTVCRMLRRIGFSRKKVVQIAKQRSVDFRAAFIAQVMGFSRECFVWVDESGSDDRNYVCKFGYSVRGMPAVSHCLLSRGKRMSAIAAISCDGMLGVDIITGTVDGNSFLDFVRGTLIPEMEPFDGSEKMSIVIMDNCSIHHIAEVKDTLTDAGILVLYLPPYSPDLNPIEEAFSYIKYYLKDHHELLQVFSNPQCILQAAFNSITPQHCNGWISHSGYC